MSLIVDFPSVEEESSASLSSTGQHRHDESHIFICTESAQSHSPLLVDFPPGSPRSRRGSFESALAATRVTFAEQEQMKIVECLVVQYRQDLWLTDSDIEQFMAEKQRNIKTIKVLQRFKKKNRKPTSVSKSLLMEVEESTNSNTTMGIEYYIDTAVSIGEFARRRKKHIQLVLEEQVKQRSEKKEGEALDSLDAIARVSCDSSCQARKRALALGTMHAESKQRDDEATAATGSCTSSTASRFSRHCSSQSEAGEG